MRRGFTTLLICLALNCPASAQETLVPEYAPYGDLAERSIQAGIQPSPGIGRIIDALKQNPTALGLITPLGPPAPRDNVQFEGRDSDIVAKMIANGAVSLSQNGQIIDVGQLAQTDFFQDTTDGILVITDLSKLMDYNEDFQPNISSIALELLQQLTPESIQMVGPVCFVDPCACGYCIPDNDIPPSILPPVSPEPSAAPSIGFGSQLTRSTPENGYEGAIGNHPVQFDYVGSETTPRINRASVELFRALVPTSITNCPIRFSRPWETVRSNYFERERNLNCTATVFDLLAFESAASLQTSERSLVEASPTLREQAIEIYRRYSRECLIPLRETISSESGFSRVLETATNEVQVRRLLASIGRVSPGVNNFTCSGVIVDTSDGLALLTAAHCLGEVVQAGEDVNRRMLQTFAEIEFMAFDGSSFLIDVDQDLDGYTYDRTNQDIAGFLLSESMMQPNMGLPLAASTFEPWEQMLVIGENPYLGALNYLDGVEGLDLLQRSMTVSLSTDCIYQAVQSGSLRYVCQTAKGMSGSPILSIRDGKFTVMGVHTRQLSSAEFGPIQCTADGRILGGVNGGISVLEMDLVSSN